MDVILKFLAWLSAIVAGLFGNLPEIVEILLVLMVLDILAGSIRSVISKTMSAKTAFNGIGKKAVILIVITMTYAMVNVVIAPDLSAPIGQAVTGFYIYSEAVSVLDNAAAIGIPVPDFLAQAIKRENKTTG